MEEETLEADAVLEIAAAERDYQHRLRVAENHKKVQLEKVASKRQKEQEAFEKLSSTMPTKRKRSMRPSLWQLPSQRRQHHLSSRSRRPSMRRRSRAI